MGSGECRCDTSTAITHGTTLRHQRSLLTHQQYRARWEYDTRLRKRESRTRILKKMDVQRSQPHVPRTCVWRYSKARYCGNTAARIDINPTDKTGHTMSVAQCPTGNYSPCSTLTYNGAITLEPAIGKAWEIYVDTGPSKLSIPLFPI